MMAPDASPVSCKNEEEKTEQILTAVKVESKPFDFFA